MKVAKTAREKDGLSNLDSSTSAMLRTGRSGRSREKIEKINHELSRLGNQF